MTDITADPPPRRRKLAVLALVGVIALGGVAGMAAPFVFTETHEASASSDPVDMQPAIKHLPIGRIAVNLRPIDADRPGARHLIIDTILTYDVNRLSADAKGDAGLDDQQPYLRDAFNEYLSNLTKDEVSGSSGMARMRSELLRRATAVVGNDAPQAILIQDYILQ